MIYRDYGGPERLEIANIPPPTAGRGQVLVRVIASSVNPIDWKRASGELRLIMPVTFPAVPGFDVTGRVCELGPGVSGYAVGERVHARIATNGTGACAELAVIGVDVMAKVPVGMESGQAAALPLAGLTALQALRDRGGLSLQSTRERVLIVGASGGVGHIAVQIARSSGATVVGVCSARNAALVSSLGAHDVIDYTKPDPFRGQKQFDLVIDCVGDNPLVWLRRLGARGRYVSPIPTPGVFARSMVNALTTRKVHPVMLKSNSADLLVLDRLVESGKLHVVIDSRFRLEELPLAWERSRSRRTVGKIVVDLQTLNPTPDIVRASRISRQTP
jgi:NADPH:quinone reductase-like Zn-dependent oxidoreductase